MLKFGKKVTYRPILVALSFALVPTIAFSFASLMRGLLVGAIILLFIIFVYYLPNLPLIFSYWQTDSKEIQYTDLHKLSSRLTTILLPFRNQLLTIQKTDIKSITINGLEKPVAQASFALPYSVPYAIMTPAISMIKNSVTLTLLMKSGQTIELNVSRDYAYNKKETIVKLNQFFTELHASGVTGNMPKVANSTKASSLERKPSL